jgi:hypothetical protein
VFAVEGNGLLQQNLPLADMQDGSAKSHDDQYAYTLADMACLTVDGKHSTRVDVGFVAWSGRNGESAHRC